VVKPLGFLALFFLVACQPSRDSFVVLPNGERLTLPYRDTLSTVISSEPPKIDWLLSSDSDSSWIEEHIMEGLVRFNLQEPGLQLEPALATHWESFQGGRVWRFHLRRDVQWSDGVTFTIQHVLDAFKRILTPENAAIAVDNIFPIKNAKAFNAGQIKNFDQVGVKAVEPWVVEFELEQPMAFFPMLLTHHTTFPVRLDVIEKHQELWTEPQNIVTLGPYRLIHWHHDSRMVLMRNDKYWGPAPAIRYLVFYMIGKPSTSLRMFERGKIDFIRDLPSSEIPRLREKPEFQSLPGLRLYYYGFKVNKPPFDQAQVRQAISLSINRKEVVKVLGGGQQALTSWVPTGMFGHDPTVGHHFDPQQAKKLLQESGWGKIENWPPVVLGFNTEEKHKQVAENIQAQLKRNLGLKIEVKNEEWKTFLNGLRSASAYNLFRLGWVADYADPHNFMAIMTSFSENNRTGWESPQYDTWVAQALRETNPEKRLALYKKAQKLLVEDEVPVIPLFTDVNQLLVSQRIENYHNNVLDLYHFFKMELKP
jgi:oligopeptide transport system substrate-binding protein